MLNIKQLQPEVKLAILWIAIALVTKNIFHPTLFLMIYMGGLVNDSIDFGLSRTFAGACYHMYFWYYQHRKYVIFCGLLAPMPVIFCLLFVAYRDRNIDNIPKFVQTEEPKKEQKDAKSSIKASQKKGDYMKVWVQYQCIPILKKEISEAACYGADFLEISIPEGHIFGIRYNGHKKVYTGQVLEGMEKVTGFDQVVSAIESGTGCHVDYTEKFIMVEWRNEDEEKS